MSVLSEQCDELRKIADALQDHFTFTGFGGTQNTDPLSIEAATLMREAAATIESLRDRLDGTRQGEFVGWLDEEWNTVLDQGQPIVRCGDCVHLYRGYCQKHVATITVDGTEYDEGAFPMDEGDFCSLGERRADA